MPHFCGVVGCGHNSLRDRVSFYRIPSEKNTRGQIDEVKKKRRIKWINALHRTDLTESKLKNIRICSDHFLSGRPVDDSAVNHPDYVPHIKMGDSEQKSKRTIQSVRKRYDRLLCPDIQNSALKMSREYIYSSAVVRSSYEGVDKCETCPYFSKSIFSRLNHVRRHRFPFQPFNCQRNDLEIYCCKKCGLEFDTVIQLKKHINEATEALRSYICRTCSFETHSILIWLKHDECTIGNNQEIYFKCTGDKKDNKQSFECDKCMYKSNWRHDLKKHIEARHTDDKDKQWFQCDKCTFKTIWRNALKKHIVAKHTNDKDKQWFQCDKCTYKTLWKDRLKGHNFEKHTDDADKKFRCNQCEYTASENIYLQRHHLAKHIHDESFKCDKCTFKTKNQANLDLHYTTKHVESETKNWLRCDKCSFKSLWKKSFDVHYKAKHTENEVKNWYKCDKCTFKSLWKPALKTHSTAKHSSNDNKKWFQCDRCTFKTTNPQCLTEHYHAKHTQDIGSKWFKCYQCPFQTIHKPNLKRHCRNKHSDDVNKK